MEGLFDLHNIVYADLPIITMLLISCPNQTRLSQRRKRRPLMFQFVVWTYWNSEQSYYASPNPMFIKFSPGP